MVPKRSCGVRGGSGTEQFLDEPLEEVPITKNNPFI